MAFTIPLNPDELLTNTRTVRRRLELSRPVPAELVRAEVHQGVLIPTGYYTGTGFKPAARQPLDEVLHWDRW